LFANLINNNNLIKANEEVALVILPRKPKSQENPMKSDITVVEAREKLRDISTIYHSYPTRSRKAQLVLIQLDHVKLS